MMCCVANRIVGSPLAHMIRERDAIVTTVHSEVGPEKLRELVGIADVVIPCAGQPGTLKAEWIKPGAVVVNVGATFDEEDDRLVSDVEGKIEE